VARNFDQIERAAQASADAVAESNTLSLPPGYISGFSVTLRKDYTVLVGGGAANVHGKQVNLVESHQLTLSDWIAPRMDTPQHYYLYLAMDGTIYVDNVIPVYNDFYGYYEQPNDGWRALGRIFVRSNLIIFASPVLFTGGR
jgi:hypothetical protein